jgi:ribosome biogenesis GTPase
MPGGGILIDNPGMREIGIADASAGLEKTFDKIAELAVDCKFKDCTHLHEVGCAIIEAVRKNEISREQYENYLKIKKEEKYFETTLLEKKRKEKNLGKIIKDFKKIKKKNNW